MRLLALFFVLIFPGILSAQEKGLSPLSASEPGSTGTTYAVVAGISDYQDPGIPDLRFADKDAEAFANFLRSPAGGSLDEDHLKVLINEEATQAQFAGTLDWLWEVAGENDRAIIYFSGHGDVEKKSLTQPGFLLCWDAPSRVYMAGGAFPLNMLQEVISTISIQNKARVIMVADACRSGKLSGNSVGGAQITGSNLAKQYANEIKILSCQPDEYSIEGEQWGGGRGAFSYHLLDGLYGLADGNGDQQVTLKEINRYLEDRVSEEVAPQHQNPMTTGGATEKLTDVYPELLAQLKKGKRGEMPLFAATDSRGMEEQVLAAADSQVVQEYRAFQTAIAEKQFMEPDHASAEMYYQKLLEEPQLAPLHSTIRRNYAAALQDEAQQALNTMLKSGLTELVLKRSKPWELYKDYPVFLDRAAQLLGDQHYMYPVLQARKFYFQGQIARDTVDKRMFYKKALDLQPDMPHAMVELIRNTGADQPDTADYYFRKAIKLVPSWVEPYLALGQYYEMKLNQPDKYEEMLQLAGQLDSNSVLVWYEKANFYRKKGKFDTAEKLYFKVLQATEADICFPCAYFNFGNMYRRNGQLEEAEKQYFKAISIDSTFSRSISSLGFLYSDMRQYEKAEKYLHKAISMDSTDILPYVSLSSIESVRFNYSEAEKYLHKASRIDSNSVYVSLNFSNVYMMTGRFAEAEIFCKKAIGLDSTSWEAHANLAGIYQMRGLWHASERAILQAIEYGPSFISFTGMLGNAYTHMEGRMQEAKTLLDRAQMISPQSGDILIYFSIWYQANQQTELAWKFLEEGLKKGLGQEIVSFSYLRDCADFNGMREHVRWKELMDQYEPAHISN